MDLKEAQEIMAEMEIPESNRDITGDRAVRNIKWLFRNLGIKNKHPKLKELFKFLNSLLPK